MRIVIVENEGLLLDLLTDSLRGRGIDVVGRARTREEALPLVDETAPDLALLDIRLVDAKDTDGLAVAEEVRGRYPDVGLLMLSDYTEAAFAERLLSMEEVPRAIGYLGKERLGDLDELIEAFTRIIRGEVVIDAYIIGKLMSRRRVADPLELLTPHERRILGLMAEGRSNRGIAREMGTKISTVEGQVHNVTHKLGLPESRGSLYNLRVLAALTFLRSTGSTPGS
ncbi:DNA-binding response regulator, NarL/FixJ family, contains REC and HTH domains [Amycolatopsis xylanica]|uniref:DNA-binding response regulator, NarL/FixJ family, contains REC and HTH domains n=1 Tax=Amycolatopsis xylanica TaxID=589385 RepID=A0A1H3FWS8_9PSEU|nr:response regulator transcription factor [Amycolatopsis xylanica]SDX94818.1 DNA-binding response regulator, NarL/FixJ family, contains REC and HTH domains [Amycolatopsis xylanica]